MFYTMDTDRDGNVSDQEWEGFYEEFVTPFETCTTDKSGLLDKTKLETCLKSSELKHFVNYSKNATEIIEGLDSEEKLNFYHYVFLRRINAAV